MAIKKSAWMIVVDADGYVLLSRRSRKVNNPGLYNFAGGSIDKGEKPSQSAIRECMEEIGIKVKAKNTKEVAVIRTERAKMSFYITYFAERPIVKHNDEVDNYVWVHPSRISTYPLHNPTFFFVNKYINLIKRDAND